MNEPVPLHDSAVRRAYRAVAVETAPAAIDEKVLELAAREIRDHSPAQPKLWHKPLAYAACLIFSVGIALELTNTPVPDLAPNTEQPPIQFDSTHNPARPGQITSQNNGGDSISGSNISEDVQKLSKNAGKLAEESVRTLGADQSCEVEASQSATNWLACIETLERDGELVAARYQRLRLLEAYPEFPGAVTAPSTEPAQ